MLLALIGLYIWLAIHRPFEVWPILETLRIERLYALLVIVIWLFSGGWGWVRNRLTLAYVAMTAAILFAWVMSGQIDEGIPRIEDWFRTMVIYVLLITTIRDEAQLRRIVLFFLVGMGVYMTHNVWEFWNGRHEFRMGVARMIGVDRSSANPNALSGTIMYALPLTFPFWAEWGQYRWRDRLLLSYYTILSVGSVILTGSRSGFIEICCLALLKILSTRFRFRAVVLLMLAAPAVWLVIPEKISNRFMTIVDPSYGPKNAQTSAEMRVEFFQIGMDLYQERPLTGHGPGSFARVSKTGYSPHNLYIQILSELGLPAMIAFAAIVVGFVLNHLDIRRLAGDLVPGEAEFAQRLSGAIMIALILMLIQGFAGHNLYRPHWVWYGAFQIFALNSVHDAADDWAEA